MSKAESKPVTKNNLFSGLTFTRYFINSMTEKMLVFLPETIKTKQLNSVIS
jgi:hypothetical protein